MFNGRNGMGIDTGAGVVLLMDPDKIPCPPRDGGGGVAVGIGLALLLPADEGGWGVAKARTFCDDVWMLNWCDGVGIGAGAGRALSLDSDGVGRA